MNRDQLISRLVKTLDEWPEWRGFEHAYPRGESYHWIKCLGGSNYCAARDDEGGRPVHRSDWEAAKGGSW